ncbi:hypothetical protein M422DRAFT_266509 [Sphaerobolus stellatus SS14]|uniref:Unplaced genomic scaffold SPHSTscaffold_162, whole genome shotgun sequence n=1 Tax=Sphaerobolus stellatus (strain SS14) TaxID=990650 RepID=A0A0C9TP01_SPHS4|nr:hypothetical protein M422DRAFT_266509 [Sphaerobolus stellatus SS14]
MDVIHADPRTIFLKLEGSMTDHAADQKQLARLLQQRKKEVMMETLGEKALGNMSTEDRCHLLQNAMQNAIGAEGGFEAWISLSKEQQGVKIRATYRVLCQQLGQEDFDQLPSTEQVELLRFISAGCGMHKDLNVVKWANLAMIMYWDCNGIDGPIKLMNKDNKAAAEIGNHAVKQRAADVSSGGGAKLGDLAGDILRNKNAKKGHQDSFKNWCTKTFGYPVTFADTSNTRFQSHCDAACDLITFLPSYIDYLHDFKDNKQNRTLNNMENYFLLGLQDIPTITELCVLALYGQVVSVPYTRVIRRPILEVNALDMGDIHRKVGEFLAKVVADPEILLSPELDFTASTVDGQVWERPEVI